MGVAVLRPRRTQAERSAATRTRLLDATIETLLDHGYAGTTTTGIARRAGLSRGAQLHHFPTKMELVLTAVEHLSERRRDDFVQAVATLPEGIDRADAAIDQLWRIISGPTFYAWLELCVAARTDPELRTSVIQVYARLHETIQRTFRELFSDPTGAHPFFDLAPTFVFAVLEGLAVSRLVSRDPSDAPRVLEALKMLARLTSVAGAP